MVAKFNVIDLFGAPGGLALGFRMTGHYNILISVDSDEVAMNTYHENFLETEIIADRIENVTARRLLDTSGMKRGKIDLVMGGPPCPGFSTIGRVKIASLVRAGKWNNMSNDNPRFIDDPRNVLYREFLRLVKGVEPKFFVMENVSGLVSHNGGGTVKQIVENFSRIGYRTDWRILDAVNYGVPQRRKRVFFIGNKLNLPNPFPAPTHRLSGGDPNDEKLNEAVTVWDAIGDVPRICQGEGKKPDVYRRKPFSHYQRWARRHSKYVFNHIARRHSNRDLKLFDNMSEGMKWKDLPSRLRKMYGYRDDVFTDKMKRLRRNRPSWTIVAHLAKDGYMYIHPTRDRSITVREAARLQSFPDTFIFYGPRTSQFSQVGNAVPPLLARAVADEISKVLEGS